MGRTAMSVEATPRRARKTVKSDPEPRMLICLFQTSGGGRRRRKKGGQGTTG